MSPAAADDLGASRKALVDAVSTDVLARSDDAKGLSAKAAVAELADEGRKVVVDVRTASADWARGVAYVEAPRTRHGDPEGWLYIAHRKDGQWIAGLEGDREFADHVATSPLVGKAERRDMTAYAQRKAAPEQARPSVGAAAANTNGLLLPWMPDYYMTLTGGAHSHTGSTGYWSSLDFAPRQRQRPGPFVQGGHGDLHVRRHGGGGPESSTPAASRRTTTTCSTPRTTTAPRSAAAHCWAASVRTPAQAGAATGAHVHWSLRTYDANYNGQYTWLNGRTIGGWLWSNGSGQYSGCATRLGVTACPGTAIYNRA